MMFVASPEYDLENNPSLQDSINCDDNEDLFLAIAALRDDSDKYQWFVLNEDAGIPEDWMKCSAKNMRVFFGDDPLIINYTNWHKATVEE